MELPVRHRARPTLDALGAGNRVIIKPSDLSPECGRVLEAAIVINTIAAQAAMPSMGFGGTGSSGMGRHHGEEGFREFSNPRGYFERRPGGVLDWIMPPYGPNTRFLIDKVAYAPIGQQLKFALPQLVKNLFASRMRGVASVGAKPLAMFFSLTEDHPRHVGRHPLLRRLRLQT